MPKFSQGYLDALFSSRDYGKLVELSGYLQEGLSRSDPTYGYPQPVFVLVESLLWFAQGFARARGPITRQRREPGRMPCFARLKATPRRISRRTTP
jgi:hypothetical protein